MTMEQQDLVLRFGRMIRVIRYSEEWEVKWNNFLDLSRTNSFLHRRSFMDYHKDRFVDYSLIVLDDEKMVGLFPANINTKNEVISHSGLTYGGLITELHDKPINTILYLKLILAFLVKEQIEKLFYKQPPSIYNSSSQEEIEYGIFLAQGKLFRIDTSFAIKKNGRSPFQERRRRAINKAKKLGVEIKETSIFYEFWELVLKPNLLSRFGVNPVHSLTEIELLALANKGCIRQFDAYLNGEILAGTTIFETPTVAHAQYISAKDEGRKNGAIDLLFDILINDVFSEKSYFDFGIVNENEGKTINRGLWDWKEGFGAKVYAHRFYEIETKNYSKIILE